MTMPTLPPVVQQQLDDFRNALAAQPQMLQTFDALIPRLIDAVVTDLDAQADTDTAKLPLGGLAASLIKAAIAGEAARAQAEAAAWLDKNLPQGSAT